MTVQSTNEVILNEDTTFDPLILALKERRAKVKVLEQEMDDIRSEWDERVRLHGKYSSDAGEIGLKKAYQTVSYDNQVVSTVAAALESISPALAAQLEGAKRIRFVGESWTVK